MKRFENTTVAMLGLSFICLAGPVAAQDGWTTSCGEGDRCTAMLVMADATTDRPFGSIGLQVGKGGTQPALIIFAPLGVAMKAGARVVIGDRIYDAPFEVCYPDGCRAVAQLEAADLETWLGGGTASLQFFPFTSDKPVAADAPLAGLRAALADVLPPAP